MAREESRGKQYDLMLSGAVERLADERPADIAARAGIAWDEARRALRLETFGKAVGLAWPAWEATPELGMWHHLSVLQYLSGADGTLPTGAWIALSEMGQGGSVRGASFDRAIDDMIARTLSDLSPEPFKARCLALGARFVDGVADVCADFDFMPRYPFRLNFWAADDEFPASGKVLVDAGVCHCLGVEAAGTMAQYLVELLGKR